MSQKFDNFRNDGRWFFMNMGKGNNAIRAICARLEVAEPPQIQNMKKRNAQYAGLRADFAERFGLDELAKFEQDFNATHGGRSLHTDLTTTKKVLPTPTQAKPTSEGANIPSIWHITAPVVQVRSSASVTAAKPPLPEAKAAVADKSTMLRSEFFALTPKAQGSFIRGGGRVQDDPEIGEPANIAALATLFGCKASKENVEKAAFMGHLRFPGMRTDAELAGLHVRIDRANVVGSLENERRAFQCAIDRIFLGDVKHQAKADVMKRADFEALAPKVRGAYIRSGGTLTD